MPKKEIIDELTKRKMIRNYFSLFPKQEVWMIVIGVLIVIGATAIPVKFVALGVIGGGVVFAAIHVFSICSYYLGKPTDQQMDEWLEEDLKVLGKKALDKMWIDETELVSDPVRVGDIPPGDVVKKYVSGIFLKKGNDNIIRYSPINVSILNFTQHQLLLYTCIFDFTTGDVWNESTKEYFYKDVVSVSITKSKNGGETFTLITYAGTTLSVPLYNLYFIKERGDKILTKPKCAEKAIQAIERAIQVIRKMIRDKRV